MLRADHCGRTLSSFLSSLAEIAGCDDGWLYYCISGSHGVCSGQRTTVTQLHCCWLLLHHCTGLHSSTLQPELVTFGAALARSRTSCLQTFAGTFTSAVTHQWSVVTGHRCDGVTPVRVTSTSRLRQTFSKLESFSSFNANHKIDF